MELPQAVTLGIQDYHQRSRRNIHPHFHHGGGHQDAIFPPREILHGLFFLPAFHPTVEQARGNFGKAFANRFILNHQGGQGKLFRFFNQGANYISLPALAQFFFHKFINPFFFFLAHPESFYRFPSRGDFIQNGNIQVAVKGKAHGTGDGGGGGEEKIGPPALVFKRRPLQNAELVLLINHGKTQIFKPDILLDKGMGSHHDF